MPRFFKKKCASPKPSIKKEKQSALKIPIQQINDQKLKDLFTDEEFTAIRKQPIEFINKIDELLNLIDDSQYDIILFRALDFEQKSRIICFTEMLASLDLNQSTLLNLIQYKNSMILEQLNTFFLEMKLNCWSPEEIHNEMRHVKSKIIAPLYLISAIEQIIPTVERYQNQLFPASDWQPFPENLTSTR